MMRLKFKDMINKFEVGDWPRKGTIPKQITIEFFIPIDSYEETRKSFIFIFLLFCFYDIF